MADPSEDEWNRAKRNTRRDEAGIGLWSYRQEAWLSGIFPVNRYHSVKLYGTTGFNGHHDHDFEAFGIAWQYR